MKSRLGILGLAALLLASGCGQKKSDEKKNPAPTAEQPADAAPALKAVEVAAGEDAACARMNDGTVRCWGRNDYGELGREPSLTDAATPVSVFGVKNAAHIYMGGDPGDQGDLVCAIMTDASVSCWGYDRLMPVPKAKTGFATPVPALQGAVQLAMGGGTLYAAMQDGRVLAWGSAAFNAIGNGEVSSKDVGVTQVPNVGGATLVAAGQNHACAVVAEGNVVCWGYPGKRQAPTPVTGVTGVTAIAATAGSDKTCAVIEGGKVTCWSERSGPAEQPGLTGVTALAARLNFCALVGSAVTCWGDNDYGQLGVGTVAKQDGREPVVGINDAVNVSVGMHAACAARATGAVDCWGRNQRGQLSDGTLIDRAAPVAVKGLRLATLPPAVDGSAHTQEAETPMSWTGLPEGCGKGGALIFRHPRIPGESLPIASAYAAVQAGGKTLVVSIASYRLDPAHLSAPPRGKQLKLGLRLIHLDLDHGHAPLDADTGTYSMNHQQAHVVIPTLSNKARRETMPNLTREGMKTGTVTISHLDDQWICGQIALRTGTQISVIGSFAARVVGSPRGG